MSEETGPEDPVARILDGRAWDEFCESLKGAREALFRDRSPSNAFDRAEGYRYLSRLVRLGLEKFVENDDPRTPRFYQLSRADAKIGADNPDAHYRNCRLDGRYDYRIRGRRGSSTYLGLGTYFGSYGSPGPSGCSGFVDADALERDSDGRFELVLSSRPRSGNWLRMQPETSSLVVREFFLDREKERGAELEIECLDAAGPPAPLDPAGLDRALRASAEFVKGTADLFTSWAERFSERPNELNAPPDAVRSVAHIAAGQVFYHGYWRLAPHEALVITARPPECRYWNFQLNNYWLESLDYRYHRVTVNKHSVVLEGDGSFRLVVAHRDPGLPNWIDTAGHGQGTMGLRWNAAVDPPRPDCRVVELAELVAQG